MSPVAAALVAVIVLGGVLLVVLGFILNPIPGRPATRGSALTSRFIALTGGRGKKAHQLRTQLGIGLIIGMVGWLITGWLVLVAIAPAATIGLPALLKPPGMTSIARLEAMEEWTRALAGVLTVGVGLEQAITATLKSAPDAIHTEVTTLVSRLRARWPTVAALRAFADDLNDATGDLIASSLILGATRRGAGLASVLEGLAATVAHDVQIRRRIEADRSKPRTTARIVTLITLGVMGVMAFNTAYIHPYGTAVGQTVLTVLLSSYVLCLIWMRQMTRSKPLPRIMGWELRAVNRAPITPMESS
jgi:Flp pilus assembly protein TadB